MPTPAVPPPVPSPSSEAQWNLPRHPRSAGRARSLLRGQAGTWRLPADTAETAVLLFSELVTNAVRHSRTKGRHIGTRCVLRPGALRVEVSDAGEGRPARRVAREDEEAGRGLALVEVLAADWGTSPRPFGIGKTVWFELPVPAEPEAPAGPLAVAVPAGSARERGARSGVVAGGPVADVYDPDRPRSARRAARPPSARR